MIEETIKNNSEDECLQMLDEIFEEYEDEEFEMPQADAEILGGILVDIEKNVDSSETVKNVIKYLMKKNDINAFDGNKVSFELKDDDVNVIKDNEGE